MLVCLASWVYIGCVCLTAGIAFRGILGRFFHMEKEPERMSITGTCVFGFIGITVYAEVYSLFSGVGAVCHLLLLAAVAAYHIGSSWARQVLIIFFERLKRLCFSWEGFSLLMLVLITAFFTSRGTFHTDTGIYHAQAIRIIEEYGVVKGIANLQLHYGYNSSYLVFCAFFTMRWLTGTALHTTTGFLFALLGGWAFHGLCHIRRHLHHGTDFLRIAMLIYILTNLTGAMSPATDYGTMALLIYLFAAFLSVVEGRPMKPPAFAEAAKNLPVLSNTPCCRDASASGAGQRRSRVCLSSEDEIYLTSLGMIAIGCLFVVSMKLSAAAAFALVLYPLIRFLCSGRWRTILKFTVLGLVVIVPYLVRNVILTGWLFYPVGVIDLFDVEWKVPLEYLENDAAQIKVWGRCLYDVDLLELSVFEWFPIWWEEQQHYAQMLIYADILSVPLFICDGILARCRRRVGAEDIRWEIVNLAVMMYAGAAMWFFTSPFLRYGLAFLLGLPLLSTGLLIENCLGAWRMRDTSMRSSFQDHAELWRIGGLWLAGLVAVCFCSWIDNYATDCFVFIKQNLTEPYYILQKPFEDPQMGEVTLDNGVTLYYALEEDKGSYYVFPSTTYQSMLERTEMIGDTIEEGFRAR